MIPLIVVGLFFLAFITIMFALLVEDGVDFVFWLILTVVAAGVSLAIVGGIGEYVTHEAQVDGTATITSEKKTPLRALNTDSSTLHGETFLLMGNVDGDRAYSYIYETPDGGFIVATTPLGSGMVYEVDGLDEPYMREIEARGNWWWTWISTSMRTEFYVPTGTVQDESYDVSIDTEVTP